MYTAWRADGKRCVTIQGPIKPERLHDDGVRLSGNEIDRIRKLRGEGLIYREISNEVGCSMQTIGDICRGTGAYKVTA